MQALQIFPERAVVRIPGVRLGRGDDPILAEKSAEIVDVAGSVCIARDARAQPENLVSRPKEPPKIQFNFLRPGEAGVAVGIQQTGLPCRQEQAPRPLTSTDPPSRTMEFAKQRSAQGLARFGHRGDLPVVIFPKWIFAAPGVKIPGGQRHFARTVVPDENRAVIAAPGRRRSDGDRTRAGPAWLRPGRAGTGPRVEATGRR